MAKMIKTDGPSVLSANDILSGRIVWWSTEGWTTSFETAVRASGETQREALAGVAAAEEAEDRVVGATLVALDPETGRPAGLREGRRFAGPSIAVPPEGEPIRIAA